MGAHGPEHVHNLFGLDPLEGGHESTEGSGAAHSIAAVDCDGTVPRLPLDTLEVVDQLHHRRGTVRAASLWPLQEVELRHQPPLFLLVLLPHPQLADHILSAGTVFVDQLHCQTTKLLCLSHFTRPVLAAQLLHSGGGGGGLGSGSLGGYTGLGQSHTLIQTCCCVVCFKCYTGAAV